MFKNENLIFSTVNAAQSDQVDVNKKKKKNSLFFEEFTFCNLCLANKLRVIHDRVRCLKNNIERVATLKLGRKTQHSWPVVDRDILTCTKHTKNIMEGVLWKWTNYWTGVEKLS